MESSDGAVYPLGQRHEPHSTLVSPERPVRRYACVYAPGNESGGSESQMKRAFYGFAESCFRFSSQIAVREYQAVFLEVGASRSLFSENFLELKLIALAKKFEIGSASVFIADRVEEAYLGAKYFRTRSGASIDFKISEKIDFLPISVIFDFLDPFGRNFEQRKKIQNALSIFSSLGIEKVGQLKKIPRKQWLSRLGKDSLVWAAVLAGEQSATWIGFYPPEIELDSEEILQMETHTLFVDVEGCLYYLRKILDRIFSRLKARSLRLTRMRVTWGPSLRSLEITFSQPQGSALGALGILRDRLQFEFQMRPLLEEVSRIEVEVMETVPGRLAQKDFFSSVEVESELWEALVLRLMEQLGSGAVFTFAQVERHFPEFQFLRKFPLVPRESNPILNSKSLVPLLDHRPIRLLPDPIELFQKNKTLFEARGSRSWSVLRKEGPERITGEWWRLLKDEKREVHFSSVEELSDQRDYFKVSTQQGQSLWVYRDLRLKKIFLHGYFD